MFNKSLSSSRKIKDGKKTKCIDDSVIAVSGIMTEEEMEIKKASGLKVPLLISLTET